MLLLTQGKPDSKTQGSAQFEFPGLGSTTPPKATASTAPSCEYNLSGW